MKRLLFLLAAFAPVLALCDAPSDPAAAFRILLRANSDTIVSLPLHRPALVEASLQTRTGNQLELSDDIPALPVEGAYLLVMSGSLEGAVLPVTALVSRTLTVTPGTYDLSTLHTESADGLAEGAIVAVIPYWTLDTVFPAGAGVQASTDPLTITTQVLMFNDSVVGINRSASAVYFYYAGDGYYSAGWYCQGDFSATRGTTRLPPNHYFMVRHPVGSNTELILTGSVQLSGQRIPVGTIQSSRAQDNLLSIPVPVPVTLDASGLNASDAFTATTDILTVKDKLLIFDNTTTGKNKSASAVYFYFAGDGFYSAGWYRFGDFSQTVGTVSLKPGEGFIIRKAAIITPATNTWTLVPSYLQ